MYQESKWETKSSRRIARNENINFYWLKLYNFIFHQCKSHMTELGKYKFYFQKIILTFMFSRYLKITEKVAFNIASETSYVYILSWQKLIKNARFILASFWKPEACGLTVLPDRSKIGGKCQNSNATFWVIFKQCVRVGPNFKKG